MFNPVAPYRYLLPNLYLSVADIANPYLFVCGSRTWISLDIARFYEEHCQPSSGSAWLAWPKNGNRSQLWREWSTLYAQGLLDCCGSSRTCRMCCLELNSDIYNSNTGTFGPDKFSICHLKHLGSRGIEYLIAFL